MTGLSLAYVPTPIPSECACCLDLYIHGPGLAAFTDRGEPVCDSCADRVDPFGSERMRRARLEHALRGTVAA